MEQQSSFVKQLAAILFNVVPSVSLIMVNKYLVTHYNFGYMMTLTTCHMFATYGLMLVLKAMGIFEAKKMDWNNIMKLSLCGLGSIAFMNLNLATNSVGFYQLSKLSCVPTTIVLQILFFNMRFSMQIFASLSVLLLGIGIATVTDVEINTLGLVFAFLAVITTTLYQIWIGSKQKELEMSQFQVLLAISPFMALWSILCIPIFDCNTFRDWGRPPVLEFQWSTEVMMVILVTCAAAVLVNVSTYVLIKTTSPLTYLVVGHAKTLLVLLGGFLIFGKDVSRENGFALMIAFIGLLLYTYFKQQPGSTTTLTPTDSKNSPPPNRSGKTPQARDVEGGIEMTRAAGNAMEETEHLLSTSVSPPTPVNQRH